MINLDEDQFEKILMKLRNKGDLSTEITQELSNIFSIEKLMLAMEKISLEVVRKCVFNPSKREIWIVGGDQEDYLVYPMNYCSCLNFFRYGIGKNDRYFCKHLIAQAILENLSINSIKKFDFIDKYNDSEFFKILRDNKII